MKLEQQVTSLEISNCLKELKVKQESYFSYCIDNSMGIKDNLKIYTTNFAKGYPSILASAFTVAELGEMLPDSITFEEKLYLINIYKLGNAWVVEFEENDDDSKTHTSYQADTEADARGKMLIYLLENKLIELK